MGCFKLKKESTCKEMKISIIVTVYNCDKYIARCLESLKRQSYDDYEIIIVNDGSQDMSAEICDRFANEHSNVKVIHKVNGGTVSARKAGLMNAKGEVVCFIDGDDWIDNEFIEKLVTPFLENNDFDIVTSGLKFEYISEPEKNFILLDGAEAGFWSCEKIKQYLLYNLFYDFEKETSAIMSSICCKMIKRELAIRAMSEIDEQLTLGEDGAYVLSVLMKAKNIFVLKEAYYHYEQHEGSQNFKFDFKAYEQLKKLQRCMEKMAGDEDNAYIIRKQIEHYIKGHLRRVEKSMFNINMDGIVYLFPEECIEAGSRIIIHGAGNVGQHYVKYVKRTRKYELVAWTDKNKGQKFVAADIPCLVKEIYKFSYDYIILAANDDHVLLQMAEDMRKYNIDMKKVLIKKPLSYCI